MSNIEPLKNISAESIYGKILEKCPSEEFGKLFSNYPYIPKENLKINQDTMDQLVELIESKVDTLDMYQKYRFISCMKNLGYDNDPNNLFSETIYNNFIENSNELVEKIKKHFQDLETKETSILLVPDEIQRFTNKNQINKEKDYCKKRYLRMISIYEYNDKIFGNEDLKNRFIELMKILNVQEPEYLDAKYIFSDNIEDIKKALSVGLNPNIQNEHGETVLFVASKTKRQDNKELEIIKLLLENGADPNFQNKVHNQSLYNTPLDNTPLYNLLNTREISDEETLKIIKLLLDKGADPNIKNEYGSTPLNSAIAGKRSIEIIELLLKNGAKPNIKDNYGETVLFTASKTKRQDNKELEIIELLFKYGAEPNIKDNNGKTPLGLAIERKMSIEIIKLLLDKGADPNFGNMYGKTVLSTASKTKRTDNKEKEIIELLNNYIKNPNIQNNDGNTA